MMFNPGTTGIGKAGAIAGFTICAVCLALVYFGKIGAMFVGVALLIILYQIVVGVLKSRTIHKSLDENVQMVERVKAVVDADTKIKVANIANEVQSDQTKKVVKQLKAKIVKPAPVDPQPDHI